MYTYPRIWYNSVKSQEQINTKTSFQLQKDRSSRLFGVRSWDWYHVKAHTLYFHTIKTLFDFDKFSVFKFEENKTTWIRFRNNFTVCSLFEMRMFAGAERYIAEYAISEIQFSRVVGNWVTPTAGQI